MHKHAQMIYDIFKGYVEGMGVKKIAFLSWATDHNLGYHFGLSDTPHECRINFDLTINAEHPPYTMLLCFPNIVNPQYVGLALSELRKTHEVEIPFPVQTNNWDSWEEMFAGSNITSITVNGDA